MAILDAYFDTLAADPGRCCYGLQHTLAALELYGIDELLVAAPAPPSLGKQQQARLTYARGDRKAAWEALAEAHHARLHWIEATGVHGKRFCKGMIVGGLLRWRIDPDEMQMITDAMNMNNTAELPKQNAVKPVVVKVEPSYATTLPEELESSRRFFEWLRLALQAELGNTSAEGLEVGVQVIIADAVAGSAPVPEALESSAAMLASEGAEVAAEQLAARWYTNGGVTCDELPPLPFESEFAGFAVALGAIPSIAVTRTSSLARPPSRTSSCCEESRLCCDPSEDARCDWSLPQIC